MATYPFNDFGTGRSQKRYCTFRSGEFNKRRLLAFQPSFSFQGLSEKKENSILLGCENLNRTNRPLDLFASEQNNSN
uniref:Ribosomal protein L32 n=1 Tax=Flemingia macrophylla TaxID=520843 RepID=A0A8F8X700_9FABA|nr:ribosomal protein L32 [Flemingia macrophylla]